MIGLKEQMHTNEILIQKISNGYIISIAGITEDREAKIFKASMGMGALFSGQADPEKLKNLMTGKPEAILKKDIWSIFVPTLEEVIEKIKQFEIVPKQEPNDDNEQ